MIFVIFFLSFFIESSVSQNGLDLGPALLCQSRCLAKCFKEIDTSSPSECQHCDSYNERWIQHNCTDNLEDCEDTCNGLFQNENSLEPMSPKLEVSEGEGILYLSWDQKDETTLYILQHRKTGSAPWQLLVQTTSTEYNFTEFSTPSCLNAIKQISVVAVNENGTSPVSNVVSLDGITTARRFHYQSGVIAQDLPDSVVLTFTWENIPGWATVVGRYFVSVVGHDEMCGKKAGNGHSATGRSKSAHVTEIDIVVAKKAVSHNCIYTFMLHNDGACYSIKNLTTEVQFDCKEFNLCVREVSSAPTRTPVVREIYVFPFYNQSALISWVNPKDVPSDYEIIVRYGELNEATGISIMSETAKFRRLPVTESQVLLTDFSLHITYGVQVAIVKPPKEPPFHMMLTKQIQIPIATGFPTSLPTSFKLNNHQPSKPGSIIHLTDQPSGQRKKKDSFKLAAIGGAGMLIIAVLFGVFCVCYLKQRRKDRIKMAIAQEEESMPNIYSTSFPSGQEQTSLDPSLYDRWEIPYNHIQIGEVLGEGAFGKVVKGKISGRLLTCHGADSRIVSESMRSRDVEVAVKMLHEFAEPSQKQEFMREIKLMKTLGYHANVVSLIACCTHQDPICLVVEHCSKGDLLNFLRSRRPHYLRNGLAEAAKDCLSSRELLSFARQIVLGMEYLSQKGYVHRDLAARNVLVMADQTLKIGDFGLTRFVYDDKVYVHRRGGRLPIKWMSIESVFDQVFTSKSDVWSFGILMYEIITLGSAPYPGVSNHDIPRFLKRGYRMQAPDGCSEELYAIMLSCWKPFQEDRPTFTVLRHNLENILEQDTPYLELDVSGIDMEIIEEEDTSSESNSVVSGEVHMDETRGINSNEVKVIIANQKEDHNRNHGDETAPMLVISAV